MCFGSSGSSPNTNLRPAPYAVDQSQTAVTQTIKPEATIPVDPAPAPTTPAPVANSATAGLTLKGM